MANNGNCPRGVPYCQIHYQSSQHIIDEGVLVLPYCVNGKKGKRVLAHLHQSPRFDVDHISGSMTLSVLARGPYGHWGPTMVHTPPDCDWSQAFACHSREQGAIHSYIGWLDDDDDDDYDDDIAVVNFDDGWSHAQLSGIDVFESTCHW